MQKYRDFFAEKQNELENIVEKRIKRMNIDILKNITAIYLQHQINSKYNQRLHQLIPHTNNISIYNKSIIQNNNNEKGNILIPLPELYPPDETKITLIQTYVRGYFCRKIYEDIIINLFIKHFTKNNYLLKIQCKYKQYYAKKQVKIFSLLHSILSQRLLNGVLINSLFFRIFVVNFTKKRMLYQDILNEILPKIRTIQLRWKLYYFRKTIHNILSYEKNCFTLNYPFYAQQVSLKLYPNAQAQLREDNKYTFDKGDKQLVIGFKYCNIRKLFILYIDKKLINNGKGGGCYCQFIVDGTITCDGRFDTITSTKDEYFNIVKF